MPQSVNKEKLIKKIEERFVEHFPGLGRISDSGHCIRWAVVSCAVLKEQGIPAVIEAGSMNYPVVPPELDDGVSPTHFSYEFDLSHPLSQMSLAIGNLPEMHVWTYIPATKEILDLTTRHLIEQTAKVAPYLNWVYRPPHFLWEHKDHLPQGTYYTPDPQARQIALNALKHILTSSPPSPAP